jgi:uncharacterized membrane protein (GlpM family)
VKEIIFKVIIGGAVVSGFALLGELLKPKSFAGLFGAAPSVSLASLALTVLKDGKAYASVEARSMLFGSFAFIVCAALISRILIRRRIQVLAATMCGIGVWFVVAFGLYCVVGR